MVSKRYGVVIMRHESQKHRTKARSSNQRVGNGVRGSRPMVSGSKEVKTMSEPTRLIQYCSFEDTSMSNVRFVHG